MRERSRSERATAPLSTDLVGDTGRFQIVLSGVQTFFLPSWIPRAALQCNARL